MQPESLISLTSARGVDATKAFEVPGTGPVRWTVAEAGMACQGQSEHVFLAMLYTYAGDHAAFHYLQWKLTQTAEAMKREEPRQWPKDLAPVKVATLVLMEQREPWKFKREHPYPDPRRIALKMPKTTWNRNGCGAYESVHTRYLAWLDAGRGMMKRWLRNQG